MNKIPRHILGGAILLIIIAVGIFAYKFIVGNGAKCNIYRGLSLQSISNDYSSGDTCKYNMEYDSVSVFLVLSDDKKNVELATVSLNSKKNPIDTCAKSSIQTNKHTYQMKSAIINGNKLFIEFNPSYNNKPICELKLIGFLEKNKISSKLFTESKDSSNLRLKYKMKISIQLDEKE
jgi:hypothetical protein